MDRTADAGSSPAGHAAEHGASWQSRHLEASSKTASIKITPPAAEIFFWIIASLVGAVASVAGLTKALKGEANDYILACTNITVEKTEQQKIDEAIQKSAVSADLAAANDGKGGPVSLVMNEAGDIISADLSKSQIALGKTGASSVDKVAAWGANSNAALAASALALVILKKRG